MSQVVLRRPEFAGIELGLDDRSIHTMRTLASKKEHSARCGGLWTDDRMARVYGHSDMSHRSVCTTAQGSPAALPSSVEFPIVRTTDETLYTDGSGKHPAEPTHRRCGCGISGETTRVSLLACWQSVYRAELRAIMLACEMQSGHGVVVTDCKGAAIVANKLKAGIRKPRGRHSWTETRIKAAIGDKQVQWVRSHLTLEQAVKAGIPAADHAYGHSCNAEADLLTSQAVQESPEETLGLPPLLPLFTQAAEAARLFQRPRNYSGPKPPPSSLPQTDEAGTFRPPARDSGAVAINDTSVLVEDQQMAMETTRTDSNIRHIRGKIVQVFLWKKFKNCSSFPFLFGCASMATATKNILPLPVSTSVCNQGVSAPPIRGYLVPGWWGETQQTRVKRLPALRGQKKS
eukprot:2051727-Amphidinium_carterae.1